MLKAIIKKEVTLTNEELAQILLQDESIFDTIDDILSDMLYTDYKMDFDSRTEALNQLTSIDYVQILRFLADKLEEDSK